jgi:ankyrin repeat protein
MPPLMAAAYLGHAELVECLLDIGTPVDQTVHGTTALMLAAMKGHTDIVRILLAIGANSCRATANGSTALICAADRGHAETISALLAARAPVDQAMCNGHTALRYAVRVLIEARARVSQPDSNGETLLHLAASHDGSPEIVQALVQAGADINHASQSGQTPLMSALRHRSGSGVKALLQAGADPVLSINGKFDQTPMYAARQAGCESLALALARNDVALAIRLAPTISYSAPATVTAKLVQAIERDDAEAVSQLLSQPHADGFSIAEHLSFFAKLNKVDVYFFREKSFTPLMAAAYLGLTGLIAPLLASGAPIDQVTHCHWSALAFAAARGHLETTRALLVAGASNNPAGCEPATAIYWAARRDQPATVQLLIDALARNNTDQAAFHVGLVNTESAQVVEVLLRHGVRVDNAAGQTALFCATVRGDVAILRLLIDAGAAVDQIIPKEHYSQPGWTPLMVAASGNKAAAVLILARAGANPNHAAGDGVTALMYCAQYGHLDSLRALIELGADLDLVDNKGETALIKAASSGRGPAALLALVQAGADVNRANGYGDTPMYELLRNKPDAKTVQALLQAGANVNHVGRSGTTALITATVYKVGAEVMQALLQAGAKVDAKNQDGKTALDYAIKYGDMQTVELLMKARSSTPSS